MAGLVKSRLRRPPSSKPKTSPAWRIMATIKSHFQMWGIPPGSGCGRRGICQFAHEMSRLELLFEAFELLCIGGQDIGTILNNIRHSLSSADTPIPICENQYEFQPR
jgi:hypothetical protein